MTAKQEPSFFQHGGNDIAYHKVEGREPTLVWLGGFRSDMDGTKALAVEGFARAHGLGCLRFDYSGHGQSGGAFEEGTIGSWTDDADAAVQKLTERDLVLVGSSMGGWIALLLAQKMAQVAKEAGVKIRLKALVLLAPAPDFTEDLMWQKLTFEQQRAILEQGQVSLPSPYDPEPTILTRALFEDGKKHLLLDGQIETACPVTILQGVADPDVPYTHAQRLMNSLVSEDVTLTLIKDGDHRLSRPQDIETLKRALQAATMPAPGELV
ncbi:MAG: alpha/beta hydrolase [Pseudomonadota bacterium]